MKFNYKKIGFLRKSIKDQSQAVMAANLGWKVSRVKKHESDASVNIGIREIETYANYFGVDLSELFDFSGAEPIFKELHSLKNKVDNLERENRELQADVDGYKRELISFERAYKMLLEETRK